MTSKLKVSEKLTYANEKLMTKRMALIKKRLVRYLSFNTAGAVNITIDLIGSPNES